MESVPLPSRETVEAIDGVHLTQLAAGERTSVQHFHIEPGARVPEHSHDHEQTGYVFAGTLTFEVGDETFRISPNDSYVIPGTEPHAAENHGEEPVMGLDIFAPPRIEPPWAE